MLGNWDMNERMSRLYSCIICKQFNVYIYIYICKHAHNRMYECVCMYVCIYIYVHYMHLQKNVCRETYIYIYTHINSYTMPIYRGGTILFLTTDQ